MTTNIPPQLSQLQSESARLNSLLLQAEALLVARPYVCKVVAQYGPIALSMECHSGAWRLYASSGGRPFRALVTECSLDDKMLAVEALCDFDDEMKKSHELLVKRLADASHAMVNAIAELEKQ